MVTTVELFAGGGGLSLGLDRAGFRHIFLVERDRHCLATLRHNRPTWPSAQEDANILDYYVMREETEGPVALLAGGPPCQPFSDSGSKKGRADDRDGWPAFRRAVEGLRPRFVVAENVPGMETTFKSYLEELLAWFRDRFSWVALWRLNAADYGAAQDRTRLFLMAGECPVDLPAPTHHDPVQEGGLLSTLRGTRPWVGMREALRLPPEATAILQGHGFKNDKPFDLDRPGPTIRTLSYSCGCDLRINESGILTPREMRALEHAQQPASGRSSVGMQARGKLKWNDGWGTSRRADDGMRAPTVREIATLQGFPADWEFMGPHSYQVSQVGNAVNVLVAEAIGRSILQAMRRERWVATDAPGQAGFTDRRASPARAVCRPPPVP